MPFTPVPFKYALAGALTLAPCNALCTLIAAGALDRLSPRRRLTPRQRRLLGLASGVGGSLLIALLTRPLVCLQRKHSPHGAAAAAVHLLSPAAAGGAAGLAVAGPSHLGRGALCALLGFLPQACLVEPWKDTTEAPEEAARRAREVSELTRRTVADIEEHKRQARRAYRRRLAEKERERQRRYRPENRPRVNIRLSED
ncbi:hypothetical protein V5S96_03490 [Corynebacterium mastitidis]|uniref:Uncharacterized protein n=1 Tax=Corynebacterium mastitidis TaxID=161890 RepID=A0ABU8NYI0_9CORY